MCILLVTKAHPEYKLVLISNRDEFFERKTHSTCWNHDGCILSPYDMAIEKKGYEHGTWLGINKFGKMAVILNLKMDPGTVPKSELQQKEPRSRGIVPLQYLKEQEDTNFDNWNTWEKFNAKHDELERTGPFTLFYGDVKTEHYSVIDYLRHSTDPFKCNEHMVISNDVFHAADEVQEARWNKTEYGYTLLDALVKNTRGIAKEELVQKCFELASNHSYREGEDIDTVTKSNIYVPPLRKIDNAESIGASLPIGDYYGTRSQIVILVDKNNKVTYEEHVLYDCDDDVERDTYSFSSPREVIKYHFDIE